MPLLNPTAQSAFLELVLNNEDWTISGTSMTDLRGSVEAPGASDLYISLHTSAPAEGGNQTSFEATYSGYARVAVSRDTGAKEWAVVDGGAFSEATNANVISFASAAAAQTVTHVGIGCTTTAGTGTLLFHEQLNNPLDITIGMTPNFPVGALKIRVT